MSKDQHSAPDATPKQRRTAHPMLTSMLRNSLSLGLFAVCTVGLIAAIYVLTEDKIAAQVRAYEAKALLDILPAGTHDNNLLDDTVMLPSSRVQLSHQSPVAAYVAYQQGVATAVILPVIAPDGYNGRIDLLVGIKRDGTLAGVRAITHKETPGLGDKINTNVSDWVLHFTGKSLSNPSSARWAVKKDGGDFDQFTGATITPRAVVAAVYRALQYFKDNKAMLLDPAQHEHHTGPQEGNP